MTYRIAYIPRLKQYGGLCEAEKHALCRGAWPWVGVPSSVGGVLKHLGRSESIPAIIDAMPYPSPADRAKNESVIRPAGTEALRSRTRRLRLQPVRSLVRVLALVELSV
eukprot:6620041-Prymnesium_polylepis.1